VIPLPTLLNYDGFTSMGWLWDKTTKRVLLAFPQNFVMFCTFFIDLLLYLTLGNGGVGAQE